jgi:hypothetical protein
MLSLDHVACPNMNHHTSSRQRKKGSSNDKMKKQQRGRNCSTRSHIPVCLPFNLILLIGMGLVILSTIRSPRCLLDLVITNTEGLAVLPEVQIGILQVQTRVGHITKIVGPKLEPTVVGHIQHKGGVDHHMLGAAVCLLRVKEELLVVMELALQITPKVVSLAALLVVELRTLWAVIEINNMVGSNDKLRTNTLIE